MEERNQSKIERWDGCTQNTQAHNMEINNLYAKFVNSMDVTGNTK